MDKVTVTYIKHSGFLVETKESYWCVWILPNTAGTDHGSDSAGILRPYYRGKPDEKHPGRCCSGSYGDHVIYFLSVHDSKWQSLQIFDNE